MLICIVSTSSPWRRLQHDGSAAGHGCCNGRLHHTEGCDIPDKFVAVPHPMSLDIDMVDTASVTYSDAPRSPAWGPSAWYTGFLTACEQCWAPSWCHLWLSGGADCVTLRGRPAVTVCKLPLDLLDGLESKELATSDYCLLPAVFWTNKLW